MRGIIAAIVFHFFAWAAGLFVFGELYDVEVKQARRELEERERDRARRIERVLPRAPRAQEGLIDARTGIGRRSTAHSSPSSATSIGRRPPERAGARRGATARSDARRLTR